MRGSGGHMVWVLVWWCQWHILPLGRGVSRCQVGLAGGWDKRLQCFSDTGSVLVPRPVACLASEDAGGITETRGWGCHMGRLRQPASARGIRGRRRWKCWSAAVVGASWAESRGGAATSGCLRRPASA